MYFTHFAKEPAPCPQYHRFQSSYWLQVGNYVDREAIPRGNQYFRQNLKIDHQFLTYRVVRRQLG